MDGKTKRKHNSDERLIAAIFELIRVKRFDEISITELCAAAGVSRKTFYRKFDSKTAIVKSGFARLFEDLTSEINFAETDARKIYLFCFEYLESHRDFASTFVDPSLHETVSDIVCGFVELALDQAFYNTVTIDPTMSAYVAPFVAEGLISIIRTWVRGGCKQSPETMSALAERLNSGVLA